MFVSGSMSDVQCRMFNVHPPVIDSSSLTITGGQFVPVEIAI
jgi:hypothetical protein